jgi:hypothetical protein
LDLKSFRMRSYEKRWGGGGSKLLTKYPVRIFIPSDHREPRDLSCHIFPVLWKMLPKGFAL